jgi:hypothetical protein
MSEPIRQAEIVSVIGLAKVSWGLRQSVARSTSGEQVRGAKNAPGCQKPYLSFVVVARNDDCGEEFLGRRRGFVDRLFFQSARHKLDAEVVVVEWNPLDDEPGLK